MVLGYQNCTNGTETSNSGNYQVSNSGHGNAYDGKLEIQAPTRMTPGQTVEIQVNGGEPPYSTSTVSGIGEFTDLGNGRFLFYLDPSETTNQVEIVVTDSLNDQATAVIQVWGVNTWFFESPRGMTRLDSENILLVEAGLASSILYSLSPPRLTQVSLNGEIVKSWDAISTPGFDLVNPEKVVSLGNNLVFVSDQNRVLYGLDIFESQVTLMLEDLNQELWNSCGGIEDIKRTPDNLLAVLCHSRIFYLDRSGSLIDQTNIERQDQIEAGAIAFDPDGNLYVAKRGGVVDRYNSTGEFSAQFVVKDDYRSNVSGTMPREMKFWKEDQLIYTNEEKYGDIIIYDISEDSSRHVHWEKEDDVGWEDMYGIAILDNGGIALNEHRAHTLLLYGSDTHLDRRLGRDDQNDFYYKDPQDVHIASGVVTVLDKGNSRIVQYNGSGELTFEISTPHLGASGNPYPGQAESITVDSKGNYYMVDRDRHRLFVYNKSGYVKTLGEGQGNGELQLDAPNSVTIHDGLLYIADGGNNRVLVWTQQGQFVRSFPASASPQHILVLENIFYVLGRFGTNGPTIEKISWDGNRIGNFETRFIVDTQVEARKIVYNPQSQRFLVLSQNFNQVIVYDQEGRFIKRVGATGTGLGEFNRPNGMDIDKDGNVFVIDTGNSRLQILPAYLF